jgi:hypothetical protein
LRKKRAPVQGLPGTEDRALIFLFCALAAIRVFIYAAAFPVFNNVDEQAHFDLVVKYSEGRVPRQLNGFAPESARFIVRYASPEYLTPPDQYPDGRYPLPRWAQPPELVNAAIDRDSAALETFANHEASQAPLYYIIAAVWMKVGGLFFHGGQLLHWIRFLNPLLIAALVWVSHAAAANLFPERRYIRLGVPLLVAFIPQDTFYGIQSDVLSPLCFALVFVNLSRFLRADLPSIRRSIITGLALAATCLVKSSNLPLLAVVMVTVLFKARRLVRARMLPAATTALGLFFLCACGPVVVWFGWNLANYGDLTGNTTKIAMLGWTPQSVAAWFQHPIFTPPGAFTFWSELMASFWRGEFVWATKPLALPWADVFYWASSALFLGLGVFGLLSRARRPAELPTRMLWFGFWSFVTLVLFLGLLSVGFDFGKCAYPSRAHPFFTSGRLLSSALIPFVLLYVCGLDRALFWTNSERLRWLVLIVIVGLLTVSEIMVNSVAFTSDYNLFHMLRHGSGR